MSRPDSGSRDGPDDRARSPGNGNGAGTDDPMSDADWAAWCASRADEEPPAEDPDEQLNSGDAGRPARSAGLADGGELDTAVPGLWLAAQLEVAAGASGQYAGASDDEAAGAIAAWVRMESYCAARKYEAVASLIRHRPAPGRGARRPGGLPGLWEEFTGTEVAQLLTESRGEGEALVETAYDLAGKLAATQQALLAGRIDECRARIIQRALVYLDEDEAAVAQEMILDRAGSLTPGGLRSAVTRAVMEVAPEKARKRREAAARTRRVELAAEESGNAQLAARELDAEVAEAIDTELTERARELKRAGVGGDVQDRRVLAFLERFGLAGDLPPSPRAEVRSGEAMPGEAMPAGRVGTAGAGVTVPGRINLTVPLATLAGQVDRPGELSGFGPVDPWQARRLGEAALGSRGSGVCVTVTDEQGVMNGHGCSRPPTRAERKTLGEREALGEHARAGPPGVSLTPFPGQDTGQLHSGSGLWVLDPGNGNSVLIVRIWPVSTDPCDHRLYTAAHDPGKELKHLTRLRYGTCTGPVCRRPARQCDFEHNRPWEEDGPTCLCNGNPKCRFEHRLKQHPGWTVTQHPDGRIDWRAPTGRTATTEPHRFPI
jgi:hypothetical protein